MSARTLGKPEAAEEDSEMPELLPERRASLSRGWRREGSKEEGFRYTNAQGRPITNARQLARIDALRIPPAWTDVRIAADPKADLQATGHDSAGRIQYLYHPDFRARQEARKYAKLTKFARALPKLRQAAKQELTTGEGLYQPRVLAAVLRLIDAAYFRIGSDEYARDHNTFGVTTLRKKHCVVTPAGEVCFNFSGKHAVKQHKVIEDQLITQIIGELLRAPGPRLFKYLQVVDDADATPTTSRKAWKPITSRLVNSYIKQKMGPDFSAKDFRTWAGTLIAAESLAESGPQETATARKRAMVQAVKEVAEQLGNTPAVARSSYISPAIFAAYEQGRTIERGLRSAERTIAAKDLDYEPQELALLRLLQVTPLEAA